MNIASYWNHHQYLHLFRVVNKLNNVCELIPQLQRVGFSQFIHQKSSFRCNNHQFTFFFNSYNKKIDYQFFGFEVIYLYNLVYLLAIFELTSKNFIIRQIVKLIRFWFIKNLLPNAIYLQLLINAVFLKVHLVKSLVTQ